MLLIPQLKFLLMELMLISMILSSKNKKDLLKINLKMHHKQKIKKLKNQKKLKMLGELKLKMYKNQLMKN